MVYTGKGRVPVKIHSMSVTDKVTLVYETTTESLFWGLVPPSIEVDIGDELFLDKVSSAGNITITEYQSPLDQVFTYLSLGLYVPYHVKIEGWGDKVKNDFN